MANTKNLGERNELEVPLKWVLPIGFVLALLIYVTLGAAPEETYIKTLLTERGITQHCVIALFMIVLTFVILKLFKLIIESWSLRPSILSKVSKKKLANKNEIYKLLEDLEKKPGLLHNRCRRVLLALKESGNTQHAMDMAYDESSSYHEVMSTSYAFPKSLVWAIPLLGFIGTVIGISNSVAGFSGFLEQTGEIDQIKEGINNVTTGLAVAFDTTFLALLLSVIVMPPLLWSERSETRLLNRIDTIINRHLLSKMVKPEEARLDESTIRNTITKTLKEGLPDAQQLIEPAKTYAELAAQEIGTIFVSEVTPLGDITSKVLKQLQEVHEQVKEQQGQQQKQLSNFIQQIQTFNQELGKAHQGTTYLAQGIGQLKSSNSTLQESVIALQKETAKVSQMLEAQQQIDRNKQATLEGMGAFLAQLQKVLERLAQPRHIHLVEQEGNINANS